MVMPDDPNFMCTGLVTVALFFGSRNITLAFAAAGFFIWALAKAPQATTITSTGSTSCLLSFMSAISFSRSHSSPPSRRSHTPALRRARAAKPSTLRLQAPGRRLERQHARGHRLGKRLVGRQGQQRDPAPGRDTAKLGP